MKRSLLMAVVAGTGLWAEAAMALSVASPFGDNMVLQQGMPVPLWGNAEPGQTVVVTFDGQSVETTTDASGHWQLALTPMTATADQAPRVLTITTGTGDCISLANVLVGEVWLCSGQSNMEWPVQLCTNAQADMDAATNDRIRMFTVGKASKLEPMSHVDGQWTVCSPATVGGFSAVGYFLADELSRELNVPVGIVNASWSGTPIEPWTPLAALEKTAAVGQRAAAFSAAMAIYAADPAAFAANRDAELRRVEEVMRQWIAEVQAKDVGTVEQWALGEVGTGNWSATDLPTPTGDFFASMWCRKVVDIPEPWVGRDLKLNLGSMDEMDTVFVNGSLVGETLDIQQWNTPRHYEIPANLVTKQNLTIVVRILNLCGAIGVGGTPADCSIVPVDATADEKPLAIHAGWERAMGSVIDVSSQPNTYVPDLTNNQPEFGTLYNGMIVPWIPYALRGVAWYQGEGNSSQPLEYTELLATLIQSWRDAWGQGDFPFLIVQLAGFMAKQTEAIEPFGWGSIRDVQREALRLPNTGLAVTTDIGDAADIHPRNKQEVGRRLALWALGTTYGRTDLVYSGPLYRDMTIEGGTVRVSFDHLGSGLVFDGEKLRGFAIASADKVFHVARAVIEGDTVLVSSDSVSKPVAVRYNWASNPIGTLRNRESLPASSFRTDDWGIQEVQYAPGETW